MNESGVIRVGVVMRDGVIRVNENGEKRVGGVMRDGVTRVNESEIIRVV